MLSATLANAIASASLKNYPQGAETPDIALSKLTVCVCVTLGWLLSLSELCKVRTLEVSRVFDLGSESRLTRAIPRRAFGKNQAKLKSRNHQLSTKELHLSQ